MKKKDALKEIEDIKNQLIKKYKPEKIILFGSAVWGKDEVRDIDLLIIKSDTPHRGIDRMREVDTLVEHNIALDMLVYKPEEIVERLKMGDPFVKHILENGRVLYG